MKSFNRCGRRAICAVAILLGWTLSAMAQTPPPAAAASAIDSGDTAWMLTSTALVLLMTIPGLALFYGGMVRKKNVLATVMQSFAITCLVTVLWVICGYSLAFVDGNNFIGGFDKALFRGIEVGTLTQTNIPESVYAMFQ